MKPVLVPLPCNEAVSSPVRLLAFSPEGESLSWPSERAIGKNASYFNSHRMMRRYATEAYIR